MALWPFRRQADQTRKAGRRITPIPGYSTMVTASYNEQTALRIPGAGAEGWFPPLQPLSPVAPPGVGGRQYDYQPGANLQYIPKTGEGIPFAMLRNLADSLPELRMVIEKRKDQVEAWKWAVQPRLDLTERARKPGVMDDPRVQKCMKFLRRPDRRRAFRVWVRMLLEDFLVIDAATVYPRRTRGGEIYSLDVIDGATIKPLLDETGRLPLPPAPAYQQILHGVPAADFTMDELLYRPRNMRSNRDYGYSPVEQVVLLVNIAISRSLFNLNYYKEGTIPDGFGTLPKEWTQEQIRQFQDYFDSLLQGGLGERRKLRFMPEGFKFEPVRQQPMKDQYDDWLWRLICFAFSIPASANAAQVNRATAETLQLTANDEGLVPLKNYIKDTLDFVIQDEFGFDDLEFVWSGDESLDVLARAQADDFDVRNGVRSRDEVRESRGLEPLGIPHTTDGLVYPLHEVIESQRKLLAQAPDLAAAGLKPPGPAQADDGRRPKPGTASRDREPREPKPRKPTAASK